MEDKQPLSGKEQDILSKALLMWLNQCPNLPSRIEYQFLPKNDVGLSMSGMEGALKLEEDIVGGYTGQFPFALYYRCQPDSSGERMTKTDVLDNIAEWIENAEEKNYPLLTDGRKVNRIYATTTSSLIFRNEAGTEDYQKLFNLEYSKGGI